MACLLAGLFAAFSVLGGIAALLTAQKPLPMNGVTSSANLELYEEDGITVQSSLGWGTLGNGSFTEPTIVENTGNVPSQLSMTTDEAYAWLDITWNCTGHTLQPLERVKAQWTLTLTNAPQGTPFSFTATVTGTEV